MTLEEAATKSGLSRGRVSQLVHGYEKPDRKTKYRPVLVEGDHWQYEVRGKRMYTVITPAGLSVLKKVKAGKVNQESEIEGKG